MNRKYRVKGRHVNIQPGFLQRTHHKIEPGVAGHIDARGHCVCWCGCVCLFTLPLLTQIMMEMFWANLKNVEKQSYTEHHTVHKFEMV